MLRQTFPNPWTSIPVHSKLPASFCLLSSLPMDTRLLLRVSTSCRKKPFNLPRYSCNEVLGRTNPAEPQLRSTSHVYITHRWECPLLSLSFSQALTLSCLLLPDPSLSLHLPKWFHLTSSLSFSRVCWPAPPLPRHPLSATHLLLVSLKVSLPPSATTPHTTRQPTREQSLLPRPMPLLSSTHAKLSALLMLHARLS